MKLYKILYLFLLFNILHILCFQNQTNYSYINNNITSIQEAIYIIRNSNGNLNLEFSIKAFFLDNERTALKKHFSIIKDKENNDTEEFYIIQDNSLQNQLSSDGETNNIISYSFNKEK